MSFSSRATKNIGLCAGSSRYAETVPLQRETVPSTRSRLNVPSHDYHVRSSAEIYRLGENLYDKEFLDVARV